MPHITLEITPEMERRMNEWSLQMKEPPEALALGLLDGEKKKAAQARLARAVENFHYRVGTGFLSTPLILDVLADIDAALEASQA